MRVPGYCEGCHKVKQTNVTQLVGAANTPIGVCSMCEERDDDDFRRATQVRRAKAIPGHHLVVHRNPSGTWTAACSCRHAYRSSTARLPVLDATRDKARLALMHNDHLAEVTA